MKGEDVQKQGWMSQKKDILNYYVGVFSVSFIALSWQVRVGGGGLTLKSRVHGVVGKCRGHDWCVKITNYKCKVSRVSTTVIN